MRRALVSSLAATCLLATGAAQAGGNVYWSIGISAPPIAAVVPGNPYYAPAPVYVQPPPVYRQPPQGYYYPPAPAYQTERGWAQTGYGYGYGNGHGHWGRDDRRWERHDGRDWERGDDRGWDRRGPRGDDRSDGRGWQGQGRWDHGPR